MQAVPVNRDKHLSARILVSGDQSIDVVRCQLELCGLACPGFLLEILTSLVDRLNLCVRRSELRYRRGRLSNGLRFRQPIKTVENCRMPMQTPIHPSKESYPKRTRKHNQGKAASGETAQAPSWRRRVNPTVHIF